MQKDIPSHFSLTGIVVSILLVTTILIQAAVGALFYGWQRASQYKDLDFQLQQITDQAGHQLENAIWNIDIDQVRQTVQNYLAIINVARITVKDTLGNVLHEARQKDSDYANNQNNTPDIAKLYSKKIDIRKNNEHLGTVEVFLTSYQTGLRLHHYLVSIAFSILIVALVQIITVYFLFRKTIINPLRSLRNFAAIVGSRSENLPDPPRGLFAGELKDLRGSILTMVTSLHNSEKSYRSIFENSLEGIFQTTMDGRFIKANSALANILGYASPEELLATVTRIDKQLHINSRRRGELLANVNARGKVVGEEVALRHKDGRIVYCLISMHAIRNDQGDILYLEGSLIDISQRKIAEEQLGALNQRLEELVEKRTEQLNIRNAELIASEERYRNLVETMQEGILLIDTNGRFTYTNRQMNNMLGVDGTALIGREYAQFFDSRNLVVFDAQIKASQGEHARKFEVTFIRSDGSSVATLVTPTIIFDEQGEVNGYFAVVTDISNLKRLQSQLLHSQKLESIGQLAAGIAHEINTPTQYVISNIKFLQDATTDLIELSRSCDLLLTSVKNNTAIQEAASAAEKEKDRLQTESLADEIPAAFKDVFQGLERIATIVSSVKKFAHPGQDSHMMADLNEAIRGTITVSTNEWKYVATVETDLDPLLPQVPCVISGINQVLLNLIVNAAHAIAAATDNGATGKGIIRIQTRIQGDFAEIRVSDTGNGIPEAIRNRIFDPFFTTKEVGKGTGQGLAIARTIITESHHGTIDFITETGRGTTFIIRLPF